MSTRAASAASSRRAKQELVRLLFGHEATSASSSIACRSQKLDHASYSYNDLRSAYLEKLQQLHPDKHRFDPNYAMKHSHFVELQDAWDNYESIAKMLKKVDPGSDDKIKDFTMFGVGCSFSDNEKERQWRSEITDEACRGWFSSGKLAEFTQDHSKKQTFNPKQTSLLDDDMFVTEQEEMGDSEISGEPYQKKKHDRSEPKAPRRSLVDFKPRSTSTFNG